MLQNINLDSDEFEDIVEMAKNKISVLYPQWTDYNYHDPGITMIELFSSMIEIQQYYMNQTGKQGKDIYFNLLGIHIEHNNPAAITIDGEVLQNEIIPEQSRIYAENIAFETTQKKLMLAGNISKMVIENEEIKIISFEGRKDTSLIREYPFGKNAKAPHCFYLIFDAPLPVRTELDIYFNISEGSPVDRNPIGDFPFYRLAVLNFDCFGTNGFMPLSIIRDETYGLIQDGSIYFRLEEEMERTSLFGEEGYFIKVSILESEYDIPPVLSGVSMNILRARQVETIFDCNDIDIEIDICNKEGKCIVERSAINSIYGKEKVFLYAKDRLIEASYTKKLDLNNKASIYEIENDKGENIRKVRIVTFLSAGWENTLLGLGNGFESQVFKINDMKTISDLHMVSNDNKIFYHEFEIMIMERGNEYTLWQKTESFYQSSASDRHYILDEKKGKIIFGDGVHGKCPEGKIHIVDLKYTLGEKGNVKSYALGQAQDALPLENVINHDPAEGGRDSETLEGALRKFRRQLREGERLVTKNDYERIIKSTPGLIIHNCKVIEQLNKPNLIEIVIKPYSENPRSILSQSYRKNIRRYLEDKRMIGTYLHFISPEYVEIELLGELELNPQYPNAGLEVEQIIRDYFNARIDKFGEPVIHSTIFNIIEKAEMVCKVNTLTLATSNEFAETNLQGDIILPPHAIALITNIRFSCR